MLYPLQRYLRGSFRDVNRWDYPRVFADLETTVGELAEKLDRHADESVTIVAHSFGDWIVRSAIRRMSGRSVSSLLSVCPVVTSVAAARVAKRVTGNAIPEFDVMSNESLASARIPDHLDIQRGFIWARGEVLIERGDTIPVGARERTVLASHNSVLFQPNGWRAIREELQHFTN